MRNPLLVTTAAIALVVSAGIGIAQAPSGRTEGGSPPSATQTAPSGGSMQPGGSAEPRGETQRAPGSGDTQRGSGSAQQSQPRETPQNQTTRPGQGGQTTQGQPDRPGATTQQQRDSGSPTGRRQETTGAAPSGAAAISSEQRTRIKQHIGDLRVGRVDNVNFSISVGTRIPRTVTLHPLPAVIVDVVPAWRRYRYILVRDEIVIIDPDTYTIIAVVAV